jgi:hypothetical protein
MKETGVLFNSGMVRAILDGRKTQTRRIIKHQPTVYGLKWIETVEGFAAWRDPGLPLDDNSEDGGNCLRICPFGKVGDHLWVRETFALEHQMELGQKPPFDDGRPLANNLDGDNNALWIQPHYKATDPKPDLCYDDDIYDPGYPKVKWTPSIHMPRWASRITLKITDVRVERLQNITPFDCRKEGIQVFAGEELQEPGARRCDDVIYIHSYMRYWESVYGKGSWSKNPFVWAISFEVIK